MSTSVSEGLSVFFLYEESDMKYTSQRGKKTARRGDLLNTGFHRFSVRFLPQQAGFHSDWYIPLILVFDLCENK